MGANGGSTRVPGAKKIIFSKVVPRPLGMLKKVFLAHFEPVVTRFGPWKIPKCLENGPTWDQKWVKNGSKTHFSKSDPRPFGMLKQVFLAHFEPVVTRFGPWKIPKCLENAIKQLLNDHYLFYGFINNHLLRLPFYAILELKQSKILLKLLKVSVSQNQEKLVRPNRASPPKKIHQ